MPLREVMTELGTTARLFTQHLQHDGILNLPDRYAYPSASEPVSIDDYEKWLQVHPEWRARAMTRGVYSITCTTSKRVYIGCSVTIQRRWQSHLSTLDTGKHQSPLLQSEWNTEGPDAFVFGIIEIVDRRRDLRIAETWWMDTYESRGIELYNRRPRKPTPPTEDTE